METENPGEKKSQIESQISTRIFQNNVDQIPQQIWSPSSTDRRSLDEAIPQLGLSTDSFNKNRQHLPMRGLWFVVQGCILCLEPMRLVRFWRFSNLRKLRISKLLISDTTRDDLSTTNGTPVGTLGQWLVFNAPSSQVELIFLFQDRSTVCPSLLDRYCQPRTLIRMQPGEYRVSLMLCR